MNVLGKVTFEELLVTRLINNTQSPATSFQLYDNIGIMDSLLNNTTHIVYSIIQFVIALILFVFLLRLIYWMSSEDKRIIIFPFEIQTYTKAYSGKILSDFLSMEIHRIVKIHNTEYIESEHISLPKVTPNREIVDSKISDLRGINIGGNIFPVGEIAIFLKHLWPVGGQGKCINCNLHECESEMRLTALMEGTETFFWDTKSETTDFNGEDQIFSRIQDLAFMIVYDLSKQRIQAKTWIGLKYFTETLEAYMRYTKTQQLKDLDIASKKCIKAKNAESNYQLLCSTFYNLGVAYFNFREFEISKEMFNHCIDLKKKDDNSYIGLGASLANLHKYEDAIKAFDSALEINQSNLDALVQKGKVFFRLKKFDDALYIYNKALEADPDNKDAIYDRACVYCKKKMKKEALEDLKNAIYIYPRWKEYAKDDEDLHELWDNDIFKKSIK